MTGPGAGPRLSSGCKPVLNHTIQSCMPCLIQDPGWTDQIITNPSYIKDLSSNLLKYQNEGSMCDAILVTGKTMIRAHSIVLAAASPLFKAAFRDGSNESCLFQIDLHEYDLFTMEVAVHFMYTGVLLLPVEYKKDFELGTANENRLVALVNSLERMGIRKERVHKCEVKFTRLEEI